jgi:hypothetical protein
MISMATAAILKIPSSKTGKKALDDNKFIAAILMDLPKAFDCLQHNSPLSKLESYGLPVQLLNFQEKLSFQLIYLLEFL